MKQQNPRACRGEIFTMRCGWKGGLKWATRGFASCTKYNRRIDEAEQNKIRKRHLTVGSIQAEKE